MKITEILFKQHIGRMIQRHWFIQGKIKVLPTSSENIVKSRGHEVVDVWEFLNARPPVEKPKIVGLYDKDPPKDKNHPDYQQTPCFIFKDQDLVIEGLEQAKVLTNSVEISEGLPERFIQEENKINLPEEVHSEIEKKIKLSCMFEATQVKLPKRKDPLKPTYWFPNEYGISAARKIELLCKNLVNICEQYGKNVKNKSVILDAFFSCPLTAHNKNIQFEVTSELLVTRRSTIQVLADPSSTHEVALPDLYPMECTAGLNHYHFYQMEEIYPPGGSSKWPYVQTAFLHFDPTFVKNPIEEDVTEEQIQGRSLLKGFSIALACARALFGSDVKTLSEPIVIPVVQTDGRMFHFSVFQLNTLELDTNSKVKNIFWNSPRIPLFLECQYRKGRPVLEEYNPDVFRKIMTFYNVE